MKWLALLFLISESKEYFYSKLSLINLHNLTSDCFLLSKLLSFACVSLPSSFLLTIQRAISASVSGVPSALEVPAPRPRIYPSLSCTLTFWSQRLFVSWWFLNLALKFRCLSWMPDIYCQVRLVSSMYGQRLFWSYYFLFRCLLNILWLQYLLSLLKCFSNPSATPMHCEDCSCKRQIWPHQDPFF